MRLTATFILLTFATYVRAAQCVPCPCTVAGENISFICGAVNKDGEPETRCLYYANFDHAPLCAYFVRARPRYRVLPTTMPNNQCDRALGSPWASPITVQVIAIARIT
ncbi:hypothetical protein EV401DRAFT_1949943 [Pisolithus croceorrhizus]|nr:hypothetical protein EV401DRAFT_1949943 [Pisolithus croceorrhizus]